MRLVFKMTVSVKLFPEMWVGFGKPLIKNARMSAWPLVGTYKDRSPTEWHFDFTIDDIGKEYVVEILFANEVFARTFRVGDVIYFGTYPVVYAAGRILSTKERER